MKRTSVLAFGCWYLVASSSCGNHRLSKVAEPEPESANITGGNINSDGGQPFIEEGQVTHGDGGIFETDPVAPAAWARTFSESWTTYVTDVVIDNSGDVLATGMALEKADFGAGVVDLADWAPFLAKYAADGKLRWVRVFKGWVLNAGGYFSPRLAVGADGAIALAGEYQGPLDFGAGPLPFDTGSFDFFVAKFNADGTTRWAKGFPAPLGQGASAVTVDSKGAVWVAGNFVGKFKLGAITVAAPSGDQGQVFVVKFSADGDPLHAMSLGDEQPQQAYALATLTDDSVVLGAGSSGTIIIPPAAPAVSTDHGAFDAVLIRFSANGVPQWGRNYGSAGRQVVRSVQSDGQGGVFALGHFTDTLTGLGDLVATPNENSRANFFLARVDANGTMQWSRAFTDPQPSGGYLNLISVDAQGNVLLPLGLSSAPGEARPPSGGSAVAPRLVTISPNNVLVSEAPLDISGEVLSMSLGKKGLAFGGTRAQGKIFGVEPVQPLTPGGHHSFIAHVPR